VCLHCFVGASASGAVGRAAEGLGLLDILAQVRWIGADVKTKMKRGSMDCQTQAAIIFFLYHPTVGHTPCVIWIHYAEDGGNRRRGVRCTACV
jgi:hypothetical protein